MQFLTFDASDVDTVEAAADTFYGDPLADQLSPVVQVERKDAPIVEVEFGAALRCEKNAGQAMSRASRHA